MAHSTTVAAGSRILPVGTAAFFGRRLSEAAGLALIAGAGLVAMAIVTYAPGDISLNTAAPAGARNALGPYGSLLADVLVQGYGIASFYRCSRSPPGDGDCYANGRTRDRGSG